jgi:peptidylprolyl isomerase
MLRLAAILVFACAMATGAARAETMVLELKDGPVTIELRPDLAPKHVERLKRLANEGFYNGVVFHRVIDGFMAQTGDPTGTGMGGSQLPDLPAEFTKKAQFKRGTIGMARSADPNSANSQFFITFADAPWLDGQYTIVGEVTDGMDAVDKIKRGEPPTNPDKIISAKVQ